MLNLAVLGLAVASGGAAADSTGWDTLETTWNLLAWNGFFGVPTSMSEAQSQGWDRVSSCSHDSRMGEMFAQNGDVSSMPYYDGYTGQLLGITLAVPYAGSDAMQSGQPWMKRTLNNGTVYYAVQFAFQDPSMICSASSDASARLFGGGVSSKYIGEGLWARQAETGRQSEDWFKPPLEVNDTALNALGFDKGKCFYQMGLHYWRTYGQGPDASCDDLYPIFLLYNNGKLNAFGIANSYPDFPYQSSKRWEHPKGSDTSIFFANGQWPTCLDTNRVLSTQHVYLDNPASMICVGSFLDKFQK